MVTEATSSHPTGWRDYSPDALPPILDAARECFMEHGYHGTTIRTLAARAGLSVPGLYHHYPSKHSMLVAITSSAMEDLYRRSSEALAEADGDVERRFELLVECLVLYHAQRRDLAFLASSEIRSLTGDSRESHIAARDRQQRLMDDIIEAGTADGTFTTQHPRDASRAIVTMCTGVAQWYRPEKALSPGEVAQRYLDIARNMTRGRGA